MLLCQTYHFVVYADINECLEDNGGCNQFCNNTNDGSYFCTCKDGYLLDVDDKGCLRKFLMFVCLQRHTGYKPYISFSNMSRQMWKLYRVCQS